MNPTISASLEISKELQAGSPLLSLELNEHQMNALEIVIITTHRNFLSADPVDGRYDIIC